MGAAAFVAGVFAQFQEGLDIIVPGFEVHTGGATAAATSIDSNGDIVRDFEEGDDALALDARAFDKGAGAADVGPVGANATRPFGELGVIGVGFENVIE